MANIVLLLVIIMLVFSVIGITVFRNQAPEYFNNLSSGILFIFSIETFLFKCTVLFPRSNIARNDWYHVEVILSCAP